MCIHFVTLVFIVMDIVLWLQENCHKRTILTIFPATVSAQHRTPGTMSSQYVICLPLLPVSWRFFKSDFIFIPKATILISVCELRAVRSIWPSGRMSGQNVKAFKFSSLKEIYNFSYTKVM